MTSGKYLTFTSFILFLLSTSCVFLFVFGQESDVLVLTSENFKQVITNNPNVLVEFYAPWCGHCKQLAPQYELAATMLKGKIIVGKVDATEETELANEYGVQGYPTLTYFKDGAPIEYEGERSAQGIVSWVSKQTLPFITTLTSAEQFNSFVKDHKTSIVGFFDQNSIDFVEKYKNFVAAAVTASDFIFAEVLSKSLINELDGKKNTLKFFRSFDNDVVYDEDSFTRAKLVQWINEKGSPLVDDVQKSWAQMNKKGLPIVVYFVQSPPEPEQAIWWVNDLAKNNRNEYSFAYTTQEQMLPQLAGITEDQIKLPTAILMDRQKIYFFGLDKELNAENTQQFLDDFSQGKIASVFKSDPIPEVNDGPVTVVVGNSFESIVLDPTKSVLVEFYAPWCGHCKSLEPIYEELGTHFKERSDVVIAKIDSTTNDNPSVTIESFPTIYFFPAGANAEPIPYSGERTLEELIDFVETNTRSNKNGDILSNNNDDNDDSNSHDEL